MRQQQTARPATDEALAGTAWRDHCESVIDTLAADQRRISAEPQVNPTPEGFEQQLGQA